MKVLKLILIGISIGIAMSAQAQQPANPTQVSVQRSGGDNPLYKITVNVVERTTKAINYRHHSGSTKVDFRGTPLLPEARGEAKVESKQGYIEIEVEFDDLQGATRFGPEYLTYVMWAITPEGRATNLGEVILNGAKSKLNVTTELQAFGLIVTAEPYFAVLQPSDVVVMEKLRAERYRRKDRRDRRKVRIAATRPVQRPCCSGRVEADPVGQGHSIGSSRSSQCGAHRPMGRRG
jgi:hypothetical protein